MTTFTFFLFILLKVSAANIVTYNAPTEILPATEFEVEVNGQKVFVYNTRTAAIAYFSFEGEVDVTVTFLSPIDNFDIRPKSKNIKSHLK